jgi:hypothetical protein
MESIKLTALRDFGVAHLPRAQRARDQKHPTQDAYHLALYGIAVLTLASATATAIERAAACLIQLTMSLSINWEKENHLTGRQRYDLSHQAITAAKDLCTLTDKSPNWLDDAMTYAPPPAFEVQPEHQPSKRLAAPLPGINLTTKEAAEYLNVREQTMHMWSSTDSGPLRPIKSGTRRLQWPSNEVLRIMQGK